PIPHVSEAARQFSPFVQRIEQSAERQEMAQTPGSGAAGPGHHRIPPEIRAKSDSELRDMLTDEMQGRLARYERQLSDFDPEHRRYFCWGPDTAPEVVEAFRRVEAAAGLVPGQVRTLAFQFVGGGHWGRTATDGSGVGTQGQPVTVTWSIAPDGTTVPSGDEDPAGPSDLIAWLDSLYPGTVTSDLTQRVWFPLMQEAMDDLAAQSGLNLVYEPNDDGATFTNFSSGQGQLGVRGDIRISGRDIDGNNGVLGFAYSPDYGDIVLETYDSFYNSTSNNSIGFVNVLTHEVGHALGLGHVCPVNQTKLMEPFINTGFRGAQFDETYSLQRQYADELEVHSGISNNDSASNATPVTLSVGSTTSWKYLSIDDSSDVDYLAFAANAGEAVTVRVIPGDPAVGSYLEGQQNSDGTCTAGTSFDPTAQQDLTIEVLSTNGSTVLATANSQPSGSTEELIEVPLPSTGTYYLRINGGSADRSQLYELQAELVVPDPAPLLVVDSTRLIDESNSGANGAADPGETVLLGVTVTNVGALAASNLSATLTGPSGFVAFDTTDDLASLAASASAELVFLFAPDGACGDSLILSLAVSDDSGYSDALQVPLDLGVPTSVPLIDEDFDGSASLPPGWTQSTSGGASPWVVSSTNADTPPNAAFSPGVTSVGDAFLNVSAGIIDSDGPTLSFRHSFDLENQRDGAVLEARLDGGSWFDLLGSAATVSAGGYSSTIGGGGRPTLRSSLDGRNAWTGSSGGFITTSIDLPSAWGGQNLELRWLLAHDSGTAGAGWYVDSVELGGAQVFVCDTFRPTVTLGAAGNTLIEGDNASSVDLTLSTPLPLAAELSVSPLISGEADASDLVAAPSFVLPVGGTSTVASVSAAADASNEGTEEITFSLPGSDPGFAAGTPSSVSINIEEGELTATVFLNDLSKVFNGSPQGVTVTTSPEGLSTSVTYDGSSTIPINAGSYDVVATVTEPNYSGSALGTLVISPATATVMLSDTSKTYDGTPQGVTVTTDPVSLPVDVTYNGFSTVPTDAGSYTVVATVTDPNYAGSETDTLVIDQATATVTLSDTSKTYDGTPQEVTVTTDPVDLPVDVTYDGSGTVPTDAGTYAVVATVSDPNYAGSDSGSLVIGQATATVTLSDTSKTY
ncbi:MAG: MBG domain-containing protein, partial [Haloferula sp.]